MESNMSTDAYVCGMRKLPKDVIQTILTCLPLRDAVRTSILSRAWRYEWSTLPSLIFDCDHMGTYDEVPEEIYRRIINRRTVEMVDHVFVLHRGPIYEFNLSVESCADIDRWILFLSRSGIRKFILDIWLEEIEIYKVPSCLFFCEDITYLELSGCNFNPPSSFKGLRKLTELNLLRVDTTEDGLKMLISHCVHLKKLKLRSIFGCTRFKLCAKELVSFMIEGEVEDLHLGSTPLLADACLKLDNSSDQSVASIKVVEVIGCLPSIERLKLGSSTLQNLAVGDIPVSLPVVCPLKQLTIDIDFDDVQQLLAAFCIFRSSPLLQKLTVKHCKNTAYAKYGDDFWQEEDFNCKFTHLRTVDVTLATCRPPELKLIEYIVGNAPLLERLQIKFRKYITDESKVLRELLRFRRCSANAEIIVLPYS